MSKKKQNAIIFAICVLLASSASVGIKTKEKKEKEQIKQELNDVTTRIDISNLAKSIYFLQVKQGNELLKTVKVVKY
jgi:hypothetical protein